MIKAKYQKMYTETHKQDMDFVIIGDYYIGPFIDMDAAQNAVSAINKQVAQQPKLTKQSTAIDTLERMGYEWHGGELWRPPMRMSKVEVEYIKVTDSIFDLRPDFEAGELYFAANGDMDNMRVIETEWHLVQLLKHQLEYTDRSYIYRKVEKQVDWRDEVHAKLQSYYHWSAPIAEVINDESDCFLELCRTALRARGEL